MVHFKYKTGNYLAIRPSLCFCFGGVNSLYEVYIFYFMRTRTSGMKKCMDNIVVMMGVLVGKS